MARAKDFMSNGNSLREEAVNLWGGQVAPDQIDELRAAKKEKVEKIDIFKIQADPTQPRRALPSTIRAAWNGETDSLTTLFRDWLGWADNEGWLGLIKAVLEGEEVERPEHIPAEIAALLEIAGLAASIKRDGLMNPVTLAKAGEGYQIESGERRWLAFHLLCASFEDAQWRQIPARLVEKVNRWRQAAENNTRADLNPIGKARQFAVLLMDLLASNGVKFADFDSFPTEQAFYAQVADGEVYRVPRGKGEQLLNATGLKSTTQLRQYRALLRLPSDVWQLADDENWGEARIRQLMNGDTVSLVTVSNDEVPYPIDDKQSESVEPFVETEGEIDEKQAVDPFAKFITRQRREVKKLDRSVLEARVGQLEDLLKQMKRMLENKRQ
jgi:hypothetical protein